MTTPIPNTVSRSSLPCIDAYLSPEKGVCCTSSDRTRVDWQFLPEALDSYDKLSYLSRRTGRTSCKASSASAELDYGSRYGGEPSGRNCPRQPFLSLDSTDKITGPSSSLHASPHFKLLLTSSFTSLRSLHLKQMTRPCLIS